MPPHYSIPTLWIKQRGNHFGTFDAGKLFFNFIFPSGGGCCSSPGHSLLVPFLYPSFNHFSSGPAKPATPSPHLHCPSSIIKQLPPLTLCRPGLPCFPSTLFQESEPCSGQAYREIHRQITNTIKETTGNGQRSTRARKSRNRVPNVS